MTIWSNWAGNQSAQAAALVRPRDTSEIQEIVRSSVAEGLCVRAAGAGHSFSPLVPTEGTIVDTSLCSGIVSIDAQRKSVRVRAGTRIADIGDPLWDVGLALKNQGDIDDQAIGGAVATATHGSGRGFTSFSGSVLGATLVTSDGGILHIGEDDTRLPAIQTSVGTLGIMTEIDLSVTSAYFLHERIEYLEFEEVLERWHEAVNTHRHYSFFWGPSPNSIEKAGLPSPPSRLTDPVYVKIYDEMSEYSDMEVGRVGRSYRIYPSSYEVDAVEKNFHEAEFFIPIEHAVEAVKRVSASMRERFPEQDFPMEVRTVGKESAFISPQFGRDSASISVSGIPGTDYWPFLREVDAILSEFGARPHWGKLHFLDSDRLHELYPRFEEFSSIRRSLDPSNTFLNGHLKKLFTEPSRMNPVAGPPRTLTRK